MGLSSLPHSRARLSARRSVRSTQLIVEAANSSFARPNCETCLLVISAMQRLARSDESARPIQRHGFPPETVNLTRPHSGSENEPHRVPPWLTANVEVQLDFGIGKNTIPLAFS